MLYNTLMLITCQKARTRDNKQHQLSTVPVCDISVRIEDPFIFSTAESCAFLLSVCDDKSELILYFFIGWVLLFTLKLSHMQTHATFVAEAYFVSGKQESFWKSFWNVLVKEIIVRDVFSTPMSSAFAGDFIQNDHKPYALWVNL